MSKSIKGILDGKEVNIYFWNSNNLSLLPKFGEMLPRRKLSSLSKIIKDVFRENFRKNHGAKEGGAADLFLKDYFATNVIVKVTKAVKYENGDVYILRWMNEIID